MRSHHSTAACVHPVKLWTFVTTIEVSTPHKGSDLVKRYGRYDLIYDTER